jgi:hypothetical protein
VHRRPPLRHAPVDRAAPGRALGVVVVLALGSTAACSGGPDPAATVRAAPQAGSPACVKALRRLPARVLDQGRAALAVDGAAAWGSPRVVLRCGLPEPAPTTKACLTVDGVDWVLDDGDPLVFTTYGRAPAAEVTVPASYGRENATAALVDLARVAGDLPGSGHACVG